MCARDACLVFFFFLRFVHVSILFHVECVSMLIVWSLPGRREVGADALLPWCTEASRIRDERVNWWITMKVWVFIERTNHSAPVFLYSFYNSNYFACFVFFVFYVLSFLSWRNVLDAVGTRRRQQVAPPAWSRFLRSCERDVSSWLRFSLHHISYRLEAVSRDLRFGNFLCLPTLI